ncbi:MAG: hypothetical protein ACREQ9_00675 [Candidatus Binatia bacterium]
MDEEQADDPAELGRRAALVVAAEATWSGHLGPLLEGKEVERLLGVRTRQAVSDLRTRRRLLGLVRKDGRVVYPAFQFADRGRPFPEMKQILEVFEEADVDEWTIASWFVTPKALLRGATPAAWLRDGGDSSIAVTAARRTVARLAH